jgi:hypothetical protein
MSRSRSSHLLSFPPVPEPPSSEAEATAVVVSSLLDGAVCVRESIVAVRPLP